MNPREYEAGSEVPKPIAVCQNKRIFDHYASWTPRFLEYCRENGIPCQAVDCYGNRFIRELDKYSALVWHYQNYVISDLLEARNILTAAHRKGLAVFPGPELNWHFDDKIAQMYAFQSVEAPIPKSWVFYLKEDCIRWLEHRAEYPLVAKLRSGSGSNNVKLLRNAEEGIKYARRMFSKGFDPAPGLGYKAYSKLQSTRDLKTLVSRVGKLPQFLNTRRHARMMPVEKGYCYFQEYIPNDGYDLKVVVVGDKMTFCARNVRKNDFRASGGGDCYYDRALLTDRIIDAAFRTADKLGMNCIGFDFVVDKKSGEGRIVEMCYGFDYEVQRDLGAYVDRDHVWHEEAVTVPDEVIRNILKELSSCPD